MVKHEPIQEHLGRWLGKKSKRRRHLIVCEKCGSYLVYPYDWGEPSEEYPERRTITLCCPQCHEHWEETFYGRACETLDGINTKGFHDLHRESEEFKRVREAGELEAEIDVFAAALDSGAIQPEDFELAHGTSP